MDVRRLIGMYRNCEDLIQAIESRRNNHKGFEKFQAYLNELALPYAKLRFIHVAGTNGKGSTCDFIRSCLMSSGYRVGTFTSPYLISHHDRIRINNIPISDEDLLTIGNRYVADWDRFELSMFEIDVLIALTYFLEHEVDFVVMEVGLGGRYDATNVITPLVSVITNIGLDHMEYLGNTIEEIAYEKAGIIKDGIPCVCGEHKKSCLDVFETVCEQRNAPLVLVDEIKAFRRLDSGMEFVYDGKTFQLKSLASYQCKNAACAIEVLKLLPIVLSEEQLFYGLSKAFWAGRFEVVNEHPLMIIDGAHNEHGMDALIDACSGMQRLKIIFSALKDKRSDRMIEKLLSLSDDITICEFDFYRSDTALHMARQYPVKIEKDYRKAIDDAFSFDGVVLITGSLYFISEVRKYCLKERSSTL